MAAILGNMEDLQGAYESAMNSNGSAMRENEAYGWLPEDEAYGRVSNAPSQPEQEDENAYSDNELAPERSEVEI